MVMESELREKLVDALQGYYSLADFADWLASARVNMHRDSAPEAQALASAISLLFYQHDDGLLTEDQLQHELMLLAGYVLLRAV